jgi:hypothetical protein
LLRDNGAVCGEWNEDKYAKKPRPYWRHDQERIFGIINARECPPTQWMPLHHRMLGRNRSGSNALITWKKETT